MKITVIGGGNVGHYLIALAGFKGHEISILTSRPEKWGGYCESYDTVHDITTTGKVTRASANAAEVIPDAELILVALPSNAYETVFIPAKKYISDGTIIGFIPGTGGVEFFCKDLMDRDCTIFGTQRVPSGTSIVEYGKKVNSLGSRKDLRIAAMPCSKTAEISHLIGELLDIDTVVLPNYLCVTLTPSNPILHTSRLSTLFKDYHRGQIYPEQLSFYKKWTNDSSEMLIGCDDELQTALQRIKLDTSKILSLKDHYEINTVEGDDDIDRMTKKINTLPYLKDNVPMVKTEDGYVPNLESRYFLEDFPYGLCIVKSFCDICNVDTPHINWVLDWFANLFNKQYFTNNGFDGKDLENLYLPQNYGIHSIDDIEMYYSV